MYSGECPDYETLRLFIVLFTLSEYRWERGEQALCYVYKSAGSTFGCGRAVQWWEINKSVADRLASEWASDLDFYWNSSDE